MLQDDSKVEMLLVVCEGATEVEYFNILKRRFRLPTWIKVMPDRGDRRTLGQHEHLVDLAATKRQELAGDSGADSENIEVWAVCDRDSYDDSFTKLKQYAENKKVQVAFSDPQFENYLLQHFSANKSASKGYKVVQELSEKIDGVLYKKGDLSWLDDMIDRKHNIVGYAIKNADNFSNHTKQPFFTVQNLVRRMLALEGK